MNKKRIAISLAATAAAVLAAGVVYGQVMPQGPSRAEVQAVAAAQFDRLDQNMDGQIDAADRADRQRAVFDTADANADGSLAFDEFAAVRGQAIGRGEFGGRGERGDRGERGRHGGRGGRDGNILGMTAVLLASDANGDRAITQAEFNTGVVAMLDRADANEDGIVTREEGMTLRTALRTEAQARRVQNRAAAAPVTAPAQ